MSAASRNKGRRGQQQAGDLLRSRDFGVAELNSGTVAEDFIAVDPAGKSWSVEVKNTVVIAEIHRKQAMAQAAKRRMSWMLLNKISGTSCWLVQRQGEKPVVWGEVTA